MYDTYLLSYLLYPQNLGTHRSDPQKALPWVERRVLSPHWSKSDAQCDLWPWQTKKQKKWKKTVANWLFAQTTHVAVSKSKFACGVASGVYFYISSFIKIGPVVLPLWVVENRPSPCTLAIGLYNSFYYRTSRDIMCANFRNNRTKTVGVAIWKSLMTTHRHTDRHK